MSHPIFDAPPNTAKRTRYNADCHCGSIKLSLALDDALAPVDSKQVVRCNCSICFRNGYLLVYPHREDVVFEDNCDKKLKSYYFGQKQQPHKFCGECGCSMVVDFSESKWEKQRGLLAVNVRMFRDARDVLGKAAFYDFDGLNRHEPKYEEHATSLLHLLYQSGGHRHGSSNDETLINEVFERIVSFLDLDTIRSLRLVGRTTAYKATQDTFRSYFRFKGVELTTPDLESFRDITSEGRLGSLVERLTLIGVVYDPTWTAGGYVNCEDTLLSKDQNKLYPPRKLQSFWPGAELREAEDEDRDDFMQQTREQYGKLQESNVALLCKAFSNLVANNANGLKSLSLQIAVSRGGKATIPPRAARCWKWILEAASRTFHMVMACLRDSKVPVRSLDIFSRSPQSLACSLPCDTLSYPSFDTISLAGSLGKLKSLSISFSDRIIPETEYDARSNGDLVQGIPHDLREKRFGHAGLAAQIMDRANYSGLSKMLQRFQEVEELDISGHYLTRSESGLERLQETMRSGCMYHLTQMKALPKLRKLRLAGLTVRDTYVVVFLERHSSTLHEVELKHISISNGRWRNILAFITSGKLEGLQVIRLEDLWEGEKLVRIRDKRKQEFRRLSGDLAGRNVLEQWGAGVRQKIRYQLRRPGRLDSWSERNVLEFGRC